MKVLFRKVLVSRWGKLHLNTQSEENVKKNGAKGYEEAKKLPRAQRDIWWFYLEIMRHGIGDQHFVDDQI